MEYNSIEYIQDIAFNNTCDRMVIVTTSKKIIIYKKIQEKSDCLISISNEKENKSNDDSDNDSKIKDEFLYNEHINDIFHKNKEFEYRWEQIQKLDVDGPILFNGLILNTEIYLFVVGIINAYIYSKKKKMIKQQNGIIY